RQCATLTNQCTIDADREPRLARSLVDAARRADAERIFVDLSVAIVVDAVADLGARPDEALADVRAASLQALLALAVRAVIEVPRYAVRHASGGRDAVIRDAVAVVVDAVAGLGLRAVRAAVVPAARDARANRNVL